MRFEVMESNETMYFVFYHIW